MQKCLKSTIAACCFSVQVGKTVQSLQKRVILFGEMQTNQVIYRLAEKTGSGHCADADFPRKPFTEFQIRLILFSPLININ